MQTYTAREIAEIISNESEEEITVRTVKYYAQMGWMPDLEVVGNKRAYTDKHLNHLRALRTLTKTGKKLSEAANELRSLDEIEVKKIGERMNYFSSNTLYNVAYSGEVFQPTEGLSVSFSSTFDEPIKKEIKEQINKILKKYEE